MNYKLPRVGTDARFMIDLIIKSGEKGLTRKEIMTEVFRRRYEYTCQNYAYDAVEHRGYKASYFTWREQYGIIPKLCEKISGTHRWVFKYLDIINRERDIVLATLFLNEVNRKRGFIPDCYLKENPFSLSVEEMRDIRDAVRSYDLSWVRG